MQNIIINVSVNRVLQCLNKNNERKQKSKIENDPSQLQWNNKNKINKQTVTRRINEIRFERKRINETGKAFKTNLLSAEERGLGILKFYHFSVGRDVSPTLTFW